MAVKTLTPMNRNEQDVKLRQLSGSSLGDASGEILQSASDMFNPKTIMQRYSDAREGVEANRKNYEKTLSADYGDALEETQDKNTTEKTSFAESTRGFATNTAMLRELQSTGEKRIRDLKKTRDQLLAQNNLDSADKISNLLIKEEEAITSSRKSFLDTYFNLRADERAIAQNDREERESDRAERSFETPTQKAERELNSKTKESILELASIAPDAGIVATDTYDTAITKYRNSETYKRNVRKGEAEIGLINANIKQSNASAYKTLNPESDTVGGNAVGYDGSFAATIDLASNLFGTKDQRNRVKDTLKTAIAQKDYKSAYAQIAQATAAGLKGEASTKFYNQANSLSVLTDLEKAIRAYTSAGGNMNIFKGTADKIQTKIGALYTDKKYAALATQLDSAFQQYRLNMTGAAFGAQESAEYASVLPASGNTLDLNLAKIEGAKKYLNSSVNGTIKTIVGEGGVHIKDYAEMGTNGEKTLTGSSAVKTSSPDFQSYLTAIQQPFKK